MSLSTNFRVRIVGSLVTLALLLVSSPLNGQEHATSPPRNKAKPVHGRRGQRSRNVGIGAVFLEPGFPVPQPQLFSRSSYSVVDLTGGPVAMTNFITSKPEAIQFIAGAEDAFRSRRYDSALRFVQRALIEDPQNGLLELLGAQALFALGDYHAAADAIGRAFLRLPPQQWHTIVANHHAWYGNGDYIVQMSRLEEFIRQHAEDEQARFVRGYHFAFLGHREAAVTDLNRVLAIDSDHRAAADLLKLLNNQGPAMSVLPPEPATTPQPTFEILLPAPSIVD